ncbi:UPF0182 family protein [Gordonia sp. (in: high G+C Gram-positive bacteria)]|uniref:UPF0182 family membrane protein n=1 Tax=Gordonia sp. (in: high G+C Gram-positive bacteria) TaxID=84139 RepID=UPI00352826CF
MVGTRGPVGRPTLSRRTKILIAVVVVLLILVLITPRIVSLWTDWLWYSDIGYRSVMSTMVTTRLLTFLVVALGVGVLIFAAVYVAYRGRPPYVVPSGPSDPLARYREVVGRRPKVTALIPAVVVGVLAGLVAQASWTTVQTFLHGQSFGVTDPQFNLDIGFYAFTLPFVRLLLDMLFLALGVAFLANLLTNYIFGGIRLGGGGRRGMISGPARAQLAVIAGLFVLTKAVAYWFDRYDLLTSDRRGDNIGATFTDVNYVLPSKLILMVIAIVCAVAFFSAIFLRDLRIPALSAVLMLVTALVIGVIWPAAMEQFSVKPSAADKEREFIQRNITATRDAYHIRPGKDITIDDGWARTPADPAKVNSDAATISNIRILDPNVLSAAFQQRLALRNVYGFPAQLSVDRYDVDDQQRDFIVAARELDPKRLGENQKNWINQHTVFTHGDGFVAAQANKVVSDGATGSAAERGGVPDFIVSDVNAVKTATEAGKKAPFGVTQPRIYFGELIASSAPDYAIVGSTEEPREYDGEGVQYRYSADSGVALSNWGVRLMYALKYGERNFLLSNALNDKSRILYNRDPRDRVKKAAPWLTVDSKTYPAVMADGSIKWIVDGYTTLPKYPYSQPTSLQNATADSRQASSGTTGRTQADEQVSYVRNSVKATVDAYSGKVELYQADDTDPVLKTWMKVFPGTVKPKSDLDKQPDLRAHLRYPEDLFKMQRSLLARYHVNDASTFFRADNFWSVPADPDPDLQGQPRQPPYYFTASAPEKQSLAQFQLTGSLNFLNRPNLSAYMTANSDPNGYGRITLKTLPTDTSTVGPTQAGATMLAEPRVTEQLKLLENTKVTYGNLLSLPVGGSGLLYVMPIYTAARGGDGAMPRVARVLTYYNATAGEGKAQVGIATTIGDALKQVGIDPGAATPSDVPADGGDQQPTPQPTPQPGGDDPGRDAAVDQLGKALDAVSAAQASGDLGKLGDALKNLNDAIANYKKYEK